MKHKFISIFIALVLALSLCLVTAVPVAAAEPSYAAYSFETRGNGVAGWSTTKVKTDFGNYSAKVTILADEDWLHHGVVKVLYGEALSTIDDADLTFCFYTAAAPTDVILFGQLYIDSEGGNVVDKMLMSDCAEILQTGEETWKSSGFAAGDSWRVVDYDPATGEMTELDPNLHGTLADQQSRFPDATLIYAAAGACGYSSGHDEAAVYIDDICIDGETHYDLEPIFLDKEAYNVGATVEVTVPNSFANTDPIRVNPVTGEPVEGEEPYNWTITATSTSDPAGITVDLEETGINTGIFTGSFATTDTTPAGEDEVYVEEGDTITVRYGETDTTAADWGAGDSLTSIEALVDDTAPTITVVFPLDGAQIDERTPDIGAEYPTAPISSVEIIFDGEDVTDDVATTVTTTSVSYTPEDDLDDGTYNVTVNIEDAAGNPATKTWSFRIVSWLEGSPVSSDPTEVSSLDELDTVDLGVAVTITGDMGIITVGRYASNPEPEAPPTFDMIDDGFFDVKVTAAVDATQIVIKFADAEITAESTAYVWDDLEGAWLECSDQGYNSLEEYLWVKVRTDTTPNIAELEGTPFAISGEAAVTLESIAASPDSVTLAVDGTQQLIVTAAYSDLSEVVVTAEADYESSDPLVATVSEAGLITAVAEGSATITVSYTEDEITKTADVLVTVTVEDILAYYRAYSGDPNVVDTMDLLKAADDWSADITPPDFPEPITTMQLLQLADEWAATE